VGVAVHEARCDQRARVFKSGEMARRQALDLSGRTHRSDAPILPPERIAFEAWHEREHPAPAQHAPLETPRVRLQVPFRHAFHMLISREREYLD
jgi:hypothetical protein